MDPEPRDSAPFEPARRRDAGEDVDAYPGQRALPRFVRLFFTISWSSFLAASVATMLCFALIDPAPIVAQFTPPGMTWSRTTIYSFGFLFIWAMCAIASGMTAWMLAPCPECEKRS